VGLPRPPGGFDRIYSPPEPPDTAHRSRLVTLPAVVGVAAAAVAVVWWLLPLGGDEEGSASGPSGGASASRPPAAATKAAGGPVYTALPPACRTVSEATVERLVPGAERTSSGNNTFGYCGYGPSSGRGAERWLEIDSRLYSATGAITPVDSARRHFDIKWRLARQVTEERTVTLEEQPGLGDQAYRWFRVDRSRPLAIGEVAVRSGNVVITVRYTERTDGGTPSARQRQRSLEEAAAVAREVLRNLR